MAAKLNPRVAQALLTALISGVVPRVGLNHIAVGRKKEVDAFLQDMTAVEDGGGAFRFICGPYGSGKSFMIQMIRNNAIERDYVVLDADLSPDHNIIGGKGKGLATYRELVQNMAILSSPNGGALKSVLERWITLVRQEVSSAGLESASPAFSEAVRKRIQEHLHALTELSYGSAFSHVMDAYWRGYCTENEDLKQCALRWLRAEYATKTDAKKDLGVDRIIEDSNWYEFLKLFARFSTFAGYKGMLIFLDEGVNLYKITNKQTRNTNYEKILTIFNDTMQGKAAHIGFFLSGTPEFIYDDRRGLYSYEALRSRLADNPFSSGSFSDLSSPVISLKPLTPEEIYLLLERLCNVHGTAHRYDNQIRPEQLGQFIVFISNRLGSQNNLSPREITKSFLSLLNTLHENPEVSFEDFIRENEVTIEKEKEDDPFFDFDI